MDSVIPFNSSSMGGKITHDCNTVKDILGEGKVSETKCRKHCFCDLELQYNLSIFEVNRDHNLEITEAALCLLLRLLEIDRKRETGSLPMSFLFTCMENPLTCAVSAVEEALSEKECLFSNGKSLQYTSEVTRQT